MAKALIDDAILADIADELNIKNNEERQYSDAELAAAIRSLAAASTELEEWNGGEY